MSMMGVLSFEAQYDNHDFNIGWGKRNCCVNHYGKVVSVKYKSTPVKPV